MQFIPELMQVSAGQQRQSKAEKRGIKTYTAKLEQLSGFRMGILPRVGTKCDVNILVDMF